MRTGTIKLPLHGGRAPAWLFQRMKNLAREVILVMVSEFGPGYVLNKLSDPFWFQAFGCILGFDWHSSGLTTTVCGALKEGIRGLENETGLFVAGGKGKASRRTPLDIKNNEAWLKCNPDKLIKASKMIAKVDNNALQDGYQLYHHTFVSNRDGEFAVIQQGMNEQNRYARRYHWLSKTIKDYVNEPHAAICFQAKGLVLDLTSAKSRKNREVSSQISSEKPEKLCKELVRLKDANLPRRHQILLSDIYPDNLKSIFLKTYEFNPASFKELLGMPGVGPKTIRALALISELVYGAELSYQDPARFSFAHGGKDGIPYPVDQENYDRSIDYLNKALRKSKIGQTEKVKALKRLYNFYKDD